MKAHLPFIVVELLLVLGGALAFGCWQLRELKKLKQEREKEEQPTQPPAEKD